MTCIVAIKQSGKVFMGADSAGVGGLSLDICKNPKIYRNGPFILGFTSSFRMGQLLGYSLQVPKQKKDEPIENFMAVTFINAVRDCLKAGGFSKKENEVETGGTFIVGYKGRIFVIFDDFQVHEPTQSFTSVGCGDHIAKGSLFSTKHLNPYSRIKTALRAAESFSAGVRKPFIVEEL